MKKLFLILSLLSVSLQAGEIALPGAAPTDNFVAAGSPLSFIAQVEQLAAAGSSYLDQASSDLEAQRKVIEGRNPYMTSAYYGAVAAGAAWGVSRIGLGCSGQDVVKPTIAAGLAGAGLTFWHTRKTKKENLINISLWQNLINAQKAQTASISLLSHGVNTNNLTTRATAGLIVQHQNVTAQETVAAIREERAYQIQTSPLDQISRLQMRGSQAIQIPSALALASRQASSYVPSLSTVAQGVGFTTLAGLLTWNILNK